MSAVLTDLERRLPGRLLVVPGASVLDESVKAGSGTPLLWEFLQ